MTNPATQGCESLISCSPGHGKPCPMPPHTHRHQSGWHLCSGYNTLLMASSRPCPWGCGVQPWGDLSGDRWSPEPTAQRCSLIIFTRRLRLRPAPDQRGLNKSLTPQGTCRQWKHQRCQLTPHPTAPPGPLATVPATAAPLLPPLELHAGLPSGYPHTPFCWAHLRPHKGGVICFVPFMGRWGVASFSGQL